MVWQELCSRESGIGREDIPYQGAGSKLDSPELNTHRRAQAPAGETSNKGQVKPSKQGVQSISSARLNGTGFGQTS